MLQNQTQQCSRCLYTSDHPLGITFNQKGLCSGCQVHEEKDNLDWKQREELLKKILKPYKSKQRNYDCVIPVTGGNDSHYMVHLAKNILGMEPLLVCYNKYFNTPLGIRNLSNLRIKFDCDLITQNINIESVKKITKHTLIQHGSIYWHCLAGHTVFPVQIAEKYKIPLILWGAHQGLEQVGMFSHQHEVEMTRRYRKDHDLFGVEAEDLITEFNFLGEEDIWQFLYPSDQQINAIGIRGIYLGNYFRWDPKLQHEKMIDLYDYKSCSFPRTFDTYDHVDCFNFMDLHDEIKLIKNGYSKVTDHASREIRFNRLTKKAGALLVKKYENQPLRYLDLFCNWLGIDEKGLDFILNQHRNKKFWHEYKPNMYKRKKSQLLQYQDMSSATKQKIKFIKNTELLMDQPKKYITVGKGFPL
jgi:N-acetyl sugar amidotransferase